MGGRALGRYGAGPQHLTLGVSVRRADRPELFRGGPFGWGDPRGHKLGISNLGMLEMDKKSGRLVCRFDPPETWSVDHLKLTNPVAYGRPNVKAALRF